MLKKLFLFSFLVLIIFATGCSKLKSDERKYQEYMNATEKCYQDNKEKYNNTRESVLRYACTKYISRGANQELFEQTIKDLG